MKYSIGVDIGGTKILAVLVDEKGSIKERIKFNTAKNRKDILIQITEAISYLIKKEKEGSKQIIKGIGVGVPGIINRNKGKLITLPNVPSLNGFHIISFLKKKFRMKVCLENDSACTSLAEYKFGLGKNVRNMFCLTLGTGIGGGIILNGKIYSGRGSAPEPGHITVEPEGVKDRCGNKACISSLFKIIYVLSKNWDFYIFCKGDI